MKYKKILLSLLVLIGGASLYWYLSYPSYEQKAEERTAAYMKAQGADSESVQKKVSRKNMQGRWEIVYRFKEEPDMLYEYTYDRSQDRILLIVFHAPNSTLMSGGRSIDRAMKYPRLSNEDSGWIAFDKKGLPIVN